MPDPIDFIELLERSLVSVLDAHASVVAITGRASDNIVAWDTLASKKSPVIAFLVVDVVEIAANGDTREARVQFDVDAQRKSDRNALLGVIERELKQSAFLSLLTPLNAKPVRRFRVGGSLDVTLRVTRPYPAAA